MKILCQ